MRVIRVNVEASEVHTRILRLGLGLEESRSYWENANVSLSASVPIADRGLCALEMRWFGAKNRARCYSLMSVLSRRYDAFPDALGVLRRWRGMDMDTRRLVCHWHMQLSDPLYRDFTGDFLVWRRSLRDASVDRNVVLRWVRASVPARLSEATLVQLASKLICAASEAGMVAAGRGLRAILLPKVPDVALTYLMYLLREIGIVGTLTENPYLASVGLEGGLLNRRLRALPGLTFRRQMDLIEFDWDSPTLAAWADSQRLWDPYVPREDPVTGEVIYVAKETAG